MALSTSEQEHQQQHTLQQRQQQRERQQVLSLVCEELLQSSHQLSAQQLVSTTCMLASLRHGHAELTGRLAQAAAAQSDALTAPQCAQLVWALGRCAVGRIAGKEACLITYRALCHCDMAWLSTPRTALSPCSLC